MAQTHQQSPLCSGHIIPGIQSSAPKPNQAFQTAQKPVMQASWALCFFFFLRLYRVHWIIWLGLFNRVTFGFSMAQMELTINYLDALIKKKQQLPCGFMRVCWGTRTRGPIVLFSFQWEGGLGRSRRGGYRIIFQEGLKPKLGFIWERRALQWRKWKRTQENRILGSVKCMKGQDD